MSTNKNYVLYLIFKMSHIYFDFFLSSALPVLAGNGCHHHPGVVVRWRSPLLPARAHPLNHSAVAVWRAALSPGQPLRVPPAVAVGWRPSSIGLKRNFYFCIFLKNLFLPL
jgi:hypothetical protein